MINERIQKLIKESGFILWEDEPWGPGRGHIDWASDYTKEMETFVSKLVTAIIADVDCFSSESIDSSNMWVETEGDIGYNQAVEQISEYLKKEYLD